MSPRRWGVEGFEASLISATCRFVGNKSCGIVEQCLKVHVRRVQDTMRVGMMVVTKSWFLVMKSFMCDQRPVCVLIWHIMVLFGVILGHKVVIVVVGRVDWRLGSLNMAMQFPMLLYRLWPGGRNQRSEGWMRMCNALLLTDGRS